MKKLEKFKNYKVEKILIFKKCTRKKRQNDH